MIHSANNSMEAVTSSANSINCLNQMVASAPASTSAVPIAASVSGVGVSAGVGGSASIIAPATVFNNNNNNNTNPSQIIEEIASENFWLREKMKEINADRDRLLCEVANLRLELDMAELKRLPEDRWVVFTRILYVYLLFIAIPIVESVVLCVRPIRLTFRSFQSRIHMQANNTKRRTNIRKNAIIWNRLYASSSLYVYFWFTTNTMGLIVYSEWFCSLNWRKFDLVTKAIHSIVVITIKPVLMNRKSTRKLQNRNFNFDCLFYLFVWIYKMGGHMPLLYLH